MNNFVFTCGDINGIGPEITLKALNKLYRRRSSKFIFICPENVFLQTIKKVRVNFRYKIIDSKEFFDFNDVIIFNIGNAKQQTGFPTAESGDAAFNAIKLSFELADVGIADGIITAPISKTALKLAGINFPGHTEMYAKWSKRKDYAMTFLSAKMNAALMTIHEPVKNISRLINEDLISAKFDLLLDMLKKDLRISSPKIAVLGLNPHAGENGFIGSEEEEIIKPVINRKKYSKNFFGTFSPDAFFANRLYSNYDMVLGMYHDQVLIPFKLLNFGMGVNYTAGLPIVRTSPDHGTAFDIAGKNKADESSILQAFSYAEKIVNNRKINERK